MNWGSKKLRIAIAVVVIIAIVLAFPLRKIYREKQFDSKSPTFEGDSTKLTQIVILPAFASPMVPGKNNIWCSSFQLAWNEMKDTVVKGPIVVTGAEELSQLMNSARQSKTDLLENSYYSTAGRVKDGIVQKIQTDMAGKFPAVPSPTFDPSDILIAYAYLEAYLKFQEPFEEIERPMTFTDSSGKEIPVKSFGIWKSIGKQHKQLCDQVDLLFCAEDRYHNVTEFALDLCKYTQPYQIVVAMIEPKATLEQTCEALHEKIKQFPSVKVETYYREFHDILAVPELFWQVSHHFTELIDKRFMGGDPVSEAYQMIRFRLDRSGAIIKSEAKLTVKSASPRMFILSKPFLIYLKKRDAQQPFFVMWVDNAELLTPK